MIDSDSINNMHTQLIRASEVAKLLNISRSKAYQLFQLGKIPTVRFGASIRVRACDLEEYIQRSWTGWKED